MRLYHLLVYEDPAWLVACQAGFFRARIEAASDSAARVGPVPPAVCAGCSHLDDTLEGTAGRNRPYFDGHGPQLQNVRCKLTSDFKLSEQFSIRTDQFEFCNHHGDWVCGATCGT
ncbi:hypothetical protein Poly21_31500 [Allorhodopirellula heiligendammensis]|uniref:Uncharacterized protein n=1 Tax=Allorhodopirellula heiligendammensis TaxID=2714739 RepID=A0A5C6BXD4_9BACT|nr:hypothetical protein Poly21_31500 [Allorhodopirellula heiligendammensis]